MIAFYPIKPVYIEKILKGEKRYELRRRLPRIKVEYVFLYATTPVCKVVGYAKVGDTFDEIKESLWQRIAAQAGVDESVYLSYFDGKENACALELLDVYRFLEPFHPNEIEDSFVVPQSFRYLEKKVFDRFKNRKSEKVLATSCLLEMTG